MNGPCGGVTREGECEVHTDRDCAWTRIYRRLEALGELDVFRQIRSPKGWSKTTRPRPRTIEVAPLELDGSS